MGWRTVVVSRSSKLDYKLGYMVVRDSENTVRVHISENSVLIIENTASSVTTALLNELTKQKIKVIFCDKKRNPSSELVSYYGSHDTSDKVRRQLEWHPTSKQAIRTAVVREKILNRRNNLRFLGLPEYELPKKTFQLRSHLVDFAQTVVRDFDFDFDFSYDIKLTEVFKLLCLKPVKDNLNLLNELVDYICIIHKYTPQKCFVVFNLHLFFSADELESFYNDIVNNHIRLLVIENKMSFEKNRFEDLIIIDNDFCEIIEN